MLPTSNINSPSIWTSPRVRIALAVVFVFLVYYAVTTFRGQGSSEPEPSPPPCPSSPPPAPCPSPLPCPSNEDGDEGEESWPKKLARLSHDECLAEVDRQPEPAGVNWKEWSAKPEIATLLSEALGEERETMKAFQVIYDDNKWGKGSGPGSSIAYAAATICHMVDLVQKFRIGLLIDAPCGDQQWAPTLRKAIPDLNYIGVDVVPQVILRNRETFQNISDGVEYFLADLIEPDVFGLVKNRSAVYKKFLEERSKTGMTRMAILSRHVIEHNTYKNAGKIFRNIDKSGANYFFGTWQPWASENKEGKTGGYRPLNFLKPPFNLPMPLLAWIELEQQSSGGILPYIALWNAGKLGNAMDIPAE